MVQLPLVDYSAVVFKSVQKTIILFMGQF